MEFPGIMGNQTADNEFRKWLYFVHSVCGGLQRPTKCCFLVHSMTNCRYILEDRKPTDTSQEGRRDQELQ